ncbi:cobaltochelatase CobT-related protein [Ensifer sp. LBL]|uniref:cobaltochelatase CobT-related protein n=1 Tax=Ensifer sp. LBL TaxID=2991056 RepID=UPI003D1F70D6
MTALVARSKRRAVSDDYRVFTRKFDRVVHAEQLSDVLGCLPPEAARSHEAAWSIFQTGLEEWRMRWHLGALSSAEAVKSAIPKQIRDDTTVTILMDQSGSMKGQTMLLAAAAIEVTEQYLRSLGCSVEILGFTTSTWQGGEARKYWRALMKPERPGRLCDLLHVIYHDGIQENSGALGHRVFKPMLRPDLPKENVDGEALQWAAQRLRSRKRRSKLLLIISDGVPVDDATLLANDPGILDRHLQAVVATLEADPDISLAALGIGHDVSKRYARSRCLSGPGDLGAGLVDLLSEMLLAAAQPLKEKS